MKQFWVFVIILQSAKSMIRHTPTPFSRSVKCVQIKIRGERIWWIELGGMQMKKKANNDFISHNRRSKHFNHSKSKPRPKSISFDKKSHFLAEKKRETAVGLWGIRHARLGKAVGACKAAKTTAWIILCALVTPKTISMGFIFWLKDAVPKLEIISFK